jgi:YD repeat-containing protein
LYIADSGDRRIRRVGPDGIITTVAGDGQFGSLGDGDLATEATLLFPTGVALAADGGLFIADAQVGRIRWVSPDGLITTVAGGALSGSSGDGGPATQAHLSWPTGVALAADGSLLIADVGYSRIRRVGPDGVITTVAGTGQYGFSGDGGPATQAKFARPHAIALAADGSLLIADADNHRIRRVGPDGIVTTVAGGGLSADSGIGTPTSAVLPGFSLRDSAIASTDGALVYHFDAAGRHLRSIATISGQDAYTFGYDTAGRLITVTDRDGDSTQIERNATGYPTAIVAPDGQRTTLTVNTQGYLATVTNPAGETYGMAYTADGLLTAFTTPRGHVNHFTYNALGHLVQDINAGGGGWTLARTKNASGYTNSLTSAAGRISTFLIEPLPTGDRRQRNTAPDGTVQETLFKTNGEEFLTTPDGTVTTRRDGPDPRFGMHAPVPEAVMIATPSGLTATTTTGRLVTAVDPNNPLHMSLIETTTVNGKAYQSTYDAATATWTHTSPAGRQRTAVLNPQGRPLSMQVADLAPLVSSYDARGRLSAITAGENAEARTTTLHYSDSGPAQGYVDSITDALGRSVQFTYDLAGRVTTQTLPDGRTVSYSYDANGNVITITPPGQPTHHFAYTPLDQEEEYTPPDLGTGPPATHYTYNLDRQLIQITRPDGQTVDLTYTAGGKLATLHIPQGDAHYTYHPTTGQRSTLTAPDGGTLTYSYDGFLLTGTTWSGPVTGSVTQTFNNDFQVTALAVNGQAVPFSYDPDSLLTQAGSLSLTRDAAHGLLTDTTLGTVTTTQSYNLFGELATVTATVNGTPQYAVTSTRDKLGRITEQTETIAGITTTVEYTYDLAGRLIAVIQNGMTVSTYTYDANGNRLSHNSILGIIGAQDRLLQYGATTSTYTANGELHTQTTTGQTTTYDYDVLGNLRTVTLPGGTTITYRIDGQNRRIGKQVNGALVQGFLYQDQLRPIAELDGAGNVVARFVYADKVNVPAYMLKGGRTYRILADHLGSPRLVIDTADGTVAQRLDYTAFGQVLLDTNPGFQPFGFAGGLYDRDTGLGTVWSPGL